MQVKETGSDPRVIRIDNLKIFTRIRSNDGLRNVTKRFDNTHVQKETAMHDLSTIKPTSPDFRIGDLHWFSTRFEPVRAFSGVKSSWNTRLCFQKLTFVQYCLRVRRWCRSIEPFRKNSQRDSAEDNKRRTAYIPSVGSESHQVWKAIFLGHGEMAIRNEI